MEVASARLTSSIRDGMGIDDFDPLAGAIRLAEAQCDLPPGGLDRAEEGSPEGEVGGDRCGESAAGAVEGLRVPLPTKSAHPSPALEALARGPFRWAPLVRNG